MVRELFEFVGVEVLKVKRNFAGFFGGWGGGFVSTGELS